jgi:hypothetical protein
MDCFTVTPSARGWSTLTLPRMPEVSLLSVPERAAQRLGCVPIEKRGSPFAVHPLISGFSRHPAIWAHKTLTLQLASQITIRRSLLILQLCRSAHWGSVLKQKLKRKVGSGSQRQRTRVIELRTIHV